MNAVIVAVYASLSLFAILARRLSLRVAPVAKGVPLSFLILYMLIAGCRALNTGQMDGGAGVWLLMMAGLACGLAGDIFLLNKARWFRQGILAFLAGHLFYSAAFLAIGQRPNWATLPGLALYASVYIFFLVRLLVPRHRAQLPIAFAYFAAIMAMTLMASFADASLASRGLHSLFFPAALLFTVSDGILAYRVFARHTRLADSLVLSTYYSAQGLMVASTIITWGL